MKHDFYIFAKAANMFIFGKQFENCREKIK